MAIWLFETPRNVNAHHGLHADERFKTVSLALVTDLTFFVLFGQPGFKCPHPHQKFQGWAYLENRQVGQIKSSVTERARRPETSVRRAHSHREVFCCERDLQPTHPLLLAGLDSISRDEKFSFVFFIWC